MEQNMDKKQVAEIVAKIRSQRGWSQEAMAREIGVSFTTINAWCNGKRVPQPFLQKKLEELANEKKAKKL
jgi:transcriptional regulator with XRE-family HTH domain